MCVVAESLLCSLYIATMYYRKSTTSWCLSPVASFPRLFTEVEEAVTPRHLLLVILLFSILARFSCLE